MRKKLQGCVTTKHGHKNRQYCAGCELENDMAKCQDVRERTGADQFFKKSPRLLMLENPMLAIQGMPPETLQTYNRIMEAETVEELYVICGVADMSCNIPKGVD